MRDREMRTLTTSCKLRDFISIQRSFLGTRVLKSLSVCFAVCAPEPTTELAAKIWIVIAVVTLSPSFSFFTSECNLCILCKTENLWENYFLLFHILPGNVICTFQNLTIPFKNENLHTLWRD